MKVSASELESSISKLLSDVLLEVPIWRAQGTPEQLLLALERGILCFPVFAQWPSPVDAWLVEAERLSRELQRFDVLATVLLRRAEVHMRRLELDAALEELSRVRDDIPRVSSEIHQWQQITRARILARQQKFDVARQLLDETTPSNQKNRVAALREVARGELHLELNEIDPAEQAFLKALQMLPFEFVEERIHVSQSLGFAYISRVNAPLTLRYLDEARQMLRGAGIAPEVIQMNLVVSSLLVAAGEQAAAQSLINEAFELLRRHPQPQMEILLQLADARSKGAMGHIDDALDAILRAAQGYAQQGNVVGYVSMIVYMANLLIQENKFKPAYRILATGVAIAKERRWSLVQDILRTHINRLRDDIVGPVRFDAMVHEMIRAMKTQ